MSLITTKSQKNFYTPEQDKLIVAMKGEGKSSKEIAAACGHSEASVVYRVTCKLSKVDSFDQIKYRGQPAITAPVPDAPSAEEATE